MVVSSCILETIKYLDTSFTSHMKFNSILQRNSLKSLAIADWIESTLLWLGQVRGLPLGKQSWDKLPTQTPWISVTYELWRTLMQDVVYPSVRTGTRP